LPSGPKRRRARLLFQLKTGRDYTKDLPTKKARPAAASRHEAILPEGPRLLVSVRSEAEALAALAGGASILDIKEPARGSLGAAPAAVRSRVAEIAAPPGEAARVLVTAAAGELAETPDPGTWEDDARIRHVKLGLAGLGAGAWEAGLDRWLAGLPAPGTGSRLIAVAYADHEGAGSPDPWSVLEYAARRGLEFLLIDTFDKRRGSLRSLLGEDELRGLIEAAREAGVGVALAGSLRREDFEPLLLLGPKILAVRGAACRGGREGDVDALRVADLARALRRDPRRHAFEMETSPTSRSGA
jgi:(5-formylfuran-3-yl)methyl phosphate synthase